MKDYYTVAEAAIATGKHQVTIRNWIKWGWIPATRMGTEWRIKPADLENVQPKPRATGA